MERTLLQRLIVVLAVLQAISIPAEVITSWFFTPAYDWIGNTISDLGATSCTQIPYPHGDVAVCSPLHLVMNGSIVVGSVAMVGLVIAARRAPGFRGLAGVAWIVSSLFALASGLVPLDVDLDLHGLVSALVFVTTPLAVLLSARQLHGALRTLGLVIGIATLVVGVAFIIWIDGSPYGGLLERLTVWPAMAWVILLGVRSVWRSRARSSSVAVTQDV